MEDFAEYVASLVDFLVSGLLVLIAIVVWFWALSSDPTSVFPEWVRTAAASAHGIHAVALLGLAYGTGVLAESVSRVILEPRLTSLTASPDRKFVDINNTMFTREYKARLAKELGPEQAEEIVAEMARELGAKESDEEEALDAATDPVMTAAGVPTPDLAGIGTQLRSAKTRARKGAAVQVREEMRYEAEKTVRGAQAIEMQLKRLRIERVTFLSVLIVLIALLLGQHWWPAMYALVALAVVGRLVDERFRRYLSTIYLSYQRSGRDAKKRRDKKKQSAGG